MKDQQLEALAIQLGEAASSHDYLIATAESCTGGGVAETITRIAGSSKWFDRGFVTYSNDAKKELLDVQQQTLENFGAVSEQTAQEMVLGALKHSHSDIAVSITGVAGPGGGTKEKPVGTVCFAWGDRIVEVKTATLHFEGDRQSIRIQSSMMALQGLIDLLEKH